MKQTTPHHRCLSRLSVVALALTFAVLAAVQAHAQTAGGMSAVSQSAPGKVEMEGFKMHHFWAGEEL